MEPMKTSQDRVYIEDYPSFSDKYKHYFKDFLVKDYEENTFGFDQRILETVCIDMDEIEIDLSYDRDRTMDMLICIAKYNNTTLSHHNKRLLPVELKLGCLSVGDISKTKLMGKDTHTRSLLTEEALDPYSIFIFTNRVAPQAKSEKSRWEKESYSSSIKNWLMMSPTDYNTYIGFKADYPYQPITDISSIAETLNQLYQNKNYDGCIDYICQKMEEAEMYKNKYNLNECTAITSALHQTIKDISIKKLPTDYSEYLSMLLDDIKALGNL